VEEYAESLRAGAEPDRYAFLAPPAGAGRGAGAAARGRRETLFALGRSSEPPLPAVEAPALIGRYRIERTLGRGASSVVYRAFDPKHERPVALKVFAGRVSEDRCRARPVSSRRADRGPAGAIRTSCRCTTPASTRGCAISTWSWSRGETLEQRLQRHSEPWTARAAAELVRTIALALDYGASAGRGAPRRQSRRTSCSTATAIRS